MKFKIVNLFVFDTVMDIIMATFHGGFRPLLALFQA